MNNKWIGLRWKCTCGAKFVVGAKGFKPFKKRVIEHAEEHLKTLKSFEIAPETPEKAIGMRWQCQTCKAVFRLNKTGLSDLKDRLREHAMSHGFNVMVKIYPIG